MNREPNNSTRHIARLAAGAFFLLALGALMAAADPHGWVYRFYAPVCHQDPARCLVVAGSPAALCVRCLALYLGLGAGHLVFAGWRLREKTAIRLLLTAIVLLAGDVLLESLGLHRDWPLVRAGTGFFLGFASAWFTLRGLCELMRRPVPHPLHV